jgi:hypothetical protein
MLFVGKFVKVEPTYKQRNSVLDITIHITAGLVQVRGYTPNFYSGEPTSNSWQEERIFLINITALLKAERYI